MKTKAVKATITLDGKTHTITISREKANQIKHLRKLIKERQGNGSTKADNNR